MNNATDEGEPEVEDPQEGDDEVDVSVRYAISSWGSDPDVDGLVRRLAREDILIPEFQRKFVWTLAQASRFIESLLLGLPIPGLFLFKEPQTQKQLVVDGQQRLRSLQAFYAGVFRGREFKLVGVSEAFSGKTYKTLSDDDRRQLDTSVVHATVFQQDEPSDDRSSVYLVFERLNTGGTPLNPQEIRACVYRGPLNRLLSELAGDANWRRIFGRRSNRMKDEEVILRILALHYHAASYERPMKAFLNNFMGKYQNADDKQIQVYGHAFRETVQVAAEHLSPAAFRPQRNFNVAVADALLVGLAHRLASGKIEDSKSLGDASGRITKRLEADDLFRSGTTDKERVRMRLQYARDEFASVK